MMVFSECLRFKAPGVADIGRAGSTRVAERWMRKAAATDDVWDDALAPNYFGSGFLQLGDVIDTMAARTVLGVERCTPYIPVSV